MGRLTSLILWLIAGGLVLGFVLGLSLTESDLLNPTTNAAKVRQLDVQTTLDRQRGEMDLSHLSRSRLQELRHKEELHIRELKNRERSAEVNNRLKEAAFGPVLLTACAIMIIFSLVIAHRLYVNDRVKAMEVKRQLLEAERRNGVIVPFRPSTARHGEASRDVSAGSIAEASHPEDAA